MDAPPPSTEAGPSSPSAQAPAAPTRARPANDPYANSNFPPPPEWYRAFTSSAWGAVKDAKGKGRASVDDEGETIGAVSAVPWEMERPRVDWIEEDGRWMAFGEEHQLAPRPESLEEAGLGHLIPPDSNLTKKQQLHLLLRSLLHTKLLLLDALGKPPRPAAELSAAGLSSEGEQYIQHMTELASGMTVIANELRPVQADATLELMLQTQLDRRRAQTAAMKEKCAGLAQRAVELKARAAGIADAEVKLKGNTER